MIYKTLITSFFSFALVTIGNVAYGQTSNEKYGMIVIDRSGSMSTRRSDGMTRCTYANALAIEKSEKWFTPENQLTSKGELGRGGTHLEIRTFDSPDNLTTIGTGYVTSISEAESYINTLGNSCGPSTALKEAVCYSIDDIISDAADAAGTPILVGKSEIFFITDAGENSSNTDSCDDDTGSWTIDVYMHYLARFGKVTINHYDLKAGNVSSLLSLSRVLNSEPELDLKQHSQFVSVNNTSMTASELWTTLAVFSGGEYIIEYDGGTTEVVVGESGDW